MKKLIALFLSLMFVFSLAACGNSQQTENTVPSTSEANVEPAASEEPADDPSETETEGSGGKTLLSIIPLRGVRKMLRRLLRMPPEPTCLSWSQWMHTAARI